jgi:hypothetical protein
MYFWKSVGHIRSEIFQVAKFTKFEVKYLESEKNEVNTRKNTKTWTINRSIGNLLVV